MGDPREHLHSKYIGNVLKRFPGISVDLSGYIEIALGTASSPAQRLASKIFWFQLQAAATQFSQELGSGAVFALLREKCRSSVIIRLIRRDKISQAFSYVSALKTGVWSAKTESERVQGLLLKPDFREVSYYLQKLKKWEAQWDILLHNEENNILTLYYEDIENDIKQAVGLIADKLNVRLDERWQDQVEPMLIRQSDVSLPVLIQEFVAWSENGGNPDDGSLDAAGQSASGLTR
jgi:LPS sulfotransferase NodH